MGKTQRPHMMGLRFYVFIALAVSCHGLPTTADAVVPERQTMLLQHRAAFTKMSPTAFISAMSSSGGSKEDCRTFADETTKAIKATVTSTQDVLNTIDTGSGCAALGQDLVQNAETKVAAAKTAAQNAETDVASKTTAKDDAASATFEVTFDLTSTQQPNCLDVTGKSSYTVVKTAADIAIRELATAKQTLADAKTAVTAAEAAHAAAVTNAAGLEKECLCRVYTEQTDAWDSASTATASHAADWKQAHELLCALDQATTCTVPTCPTVSKPTVASGVVKCGLPIEVEYTAGYKTIWIHGCSKGEYKCQARKVCDYVTSSTCVYQAYHCNGPQYGGSYYPPGVGAGGSAINFGYGFDFAPHPPYGKDYGNICMCNHAFGPKYDLATTHTNCGVGSWKLNPPM